MFKKLILKQFPFLLIYTNMIFGQTVQETNDASFIKSVVFKSKNDEFQLPIVALGEVFELSFDDLNADERNYYYRIKYFNHDWTPTSLFQSEFMRGFDNIRIENYRTSFNTLQPYTNYKLKLPNEETKFLLSGNYILEVYNDDDILIFSRRFLIYENKVDVGAAVYRSRDLTFYQTHQCIQFSINPEAGKFLRDPENLIHTVILQNEQWNSAITDIKPQYFNGNRLEYRYQKKTGFEGGNEYLFFDTKDIRSTGSNVGSVELNRLYETYLNTNFLRRGYPYSFNADINGDFFIRTLEGSEDEAIEADYSWVHFSLSAPKFLEGQEVYIYGKFNNYQLTDENKMYFNPGLEIYEGIILLKQGFYNYKYVAKSSDQLLTNSLSDSHALTENRYLILVYYSEFGARNDALIGIGKASSFEILD
tara:strand:- start:1894 stop:3153 length:1260 start_codon:yes stop_codon:yes gene_type:complete